MKIIYFTTAIERDDYKELAKIWKTSLNPSNQNFHNKMIRSLALSNEVEVVAVRPFSPRHCTKKVLEAEDKVEGNIHWHYVKMKGGKIRRQFIVKKEIAKLMKKLDTKDAVIVSDTINPTVIYNANLAKKKYNLPLVGIVTDSPSNISNTPRSYTMFLLKQSSDLDGYISLTAGLNDMFNENDKPAIQIEGIVEDNDVRPIQNKYGQYFFFGGALMERYGVFNLIDAFTELKRDDINLVICGHHGDPKKIKAAINKNKNIHYLKMIPVREVLQLEANAFANINPRPYSQDLDRFSIPSKTIEYYTSGKLTISSQSTILSKHFASCTIWCGYAKKEEILSAMKKALAMDEEKRLEMGAKAKEKARELYSLASVDKKLSKFLLQFIK